MDETVEIALQGAEGLAAAHRKGIVHRDIKPANVMLAADGQAKIVNLGVAKLSGQTRLTKTGSALGTAAYMSPEQAAGQNVDHRSDLFSLGVVLFEMLTETLLFEGRPEVALIAAILNRDQGFGLFANLTPPSASSARTRRRTWSEG